VNRTDRLYALVEELRAVSPRRRSARELAARFEVSTRTIERDISALQQAGVPIYAEPGRRGGYVLDATMTLPPVNFTPAEAVAIALALSLTGDRPFAGHARTALRKLVAAMPRPDGERARDIAARVGYVRLTGRAGADRAAAGGDARPRRTGRTGGRAEAGPGGAGMPAYGEGARAVARAIEDALVHRHVLRIEYVDGVGSASVREIEPGLFIGGGSGLWYLAAWCRLRDQRRVFRLDRIRSAVTTGERFPARPLAQFTGDLPESVFLDPVFD
jgi:Predicted transcriptional regulator